jgi:hypothetical protein
MRNLRKYGLIGLPVSVALFFVGVMTGGFGICGPTNNVSPAVMVAGFWGAACAVVALIVSVPTLIVRRMRIEEATDEGTV